MFHDKSAEETMHLLVFLNSSFGKVLRGREMTINFMNKMYIEIGQRNSITASNAIINIEGTYVFHSSSLFSLNSVQ